MSQNKCGLRFLQGRFLSLWTYIQLTLDRHTVVNQASGPSILTLVWFCKGPVYNCPLCQILVTHFMTAVWLICMLQQSFSNTTRTMHAHNALRRSTPVRMCALRMRVDHGAQEWLWLNRTWKVSIIYTWLVKTLHSVLSFFALSLVLVLPS